MVSAHEKHKYHSCKVINIFSCLILYRLGGAVEDKQSKDQVPQLFFLFFFLVNILQSKIRVEHTADSFLRKRLMNILFDTSGGKCADMV